MMNALKSALLTLALTLGVISIHPAHASLSQSPALASDQASTPAAPFGRCSAPTPSVQTIRHSWIQPIVHSSNTFGNPLFRQESSCRFRADSRFSAPSASPEDSLNHYRSELNRLFTYIYECPSSQRWMARDSFNLFAKAVMEIYEGRDFPFGQIRNLNYFQASDGSFRMLNWGIPDDNGTVSYKALLQVRLSQSGDSSSAWQSLDSDCRKPTAKKDRPRSQASLPPRSYTYIIYDMSDMSLYQPYPEQLECTPETWWGAFYYSCIERQAEGKTYYTFLGWNAGQPLYQQSVIEVMYIGEQGDVHFGAPLFANSGRVPGREPMPVQVADQDYRRVVFRFGRRTGMILRYDYQTYLVTNKRGKPKKVNADMIVFDQLMPQQIAMSDDYAYYVPQGGVYQAYVWIDGKWRLQLDVEARNRE